MEDNKREKKVNEGEVIVMLKKKKCHILSWNSENTSLKTQQHFRLSYNILQRKERESARREKSGKPLKRNTFGGIMIRIL